MLGLVSQMGVTRRSKNRVMAEEFLNLDQVDAGFDQVSGIAVAKTVWRDLFLCLRRPRRRRYPSD